MRFLAAIAVLSLLSACAELANVRPDPGINWTYSATPIAPNTFHVVARDSRFGSSSDVEELFRRAVLKVVAQNQCKSYRIDKYSTYLENATFGGTIPIIEGDIVCTK